MVEGTAKARVGRIMRTRTLPAVSPSDYAIGDEVDFHRPQSRKDLPGWSGPATVTDNTQISRGTLGLRWQGTLHPSVKLGDVRPHEGFFTFFLLAHGERLLSSSKGAMNIIIVTATDDPLKEAKEVSLKTGMVA